MRAGGVRSGEDGGRGSWETQLELGEVHLWDELETYCGGNSQESMTVTLANPPSSEGYRA